MEKEHDYYLDILKEELLPALGCTEPIALAYASAKCREILGSEAERIKVKCSANIIKNVKAVVVPNCGGLKGIETAVAAGMLFGESNRNLEVLEGMKEREVEKVKDYLAKDKVSVSLLESDAKLHFVIEMENGKENALIEVVHQHTNIVRIEKNGKTLLSVPYSETEINESLTDRSALSVSSIVSFAENVDVDLLKTIIEPQIECNIAIAEEGLKKDYGAEVGKTIAEDKNLSFTAAEASALAAAASDARMSGCSFPVVINSGSGNQGITVSVPVIVYAKKNNISHERLIRALAISNLLAIHEKTKIGRLSAYCGAATAGAAAGAAITWLSGGTIEDIENTMVNSLACISGMICDGAKPSCALKIAVAVNAAFLSHEMSLKHRHFHSGEGIVKEDVEATVSAVGQIASDGMRDTDKVILGVMLEN